MFSVLFFNLDKRICRGVPLFLALLDALEVIELAGGIANDSCFAWLPVGWTHFVGMRVRVLKKQKRRKGREGEEVKHDKSEQHEIEDKFVPKGGHMAEEIVYERGGSAARDRKGGGKRDKDGDGNRKRHVPHQKCIRKARDRRAIGANM